ncbi:hypothetical protein PPTG_07143 [Phytophthora nicotianae INRA-310]|uniref:Uncharacterized protein n=1 Tax=Phytophthora nicotianae (strain INRA-310) TaxID=761204 RepID=W2QPM7_PHYN3|nr:hypothetical protein PPTG_07143 [Phytophthora nicotianae INRA-310]ETN14896.1 hypothetical protein PPTG_07143 [Phytophthora nicotianae INRA-310]
MRRCLHSRLIITPMNREVNMSHQLCIYVRAGRGGACRGLPRLASGRTAHFRRDSAYPLQRRTALQVAGHCHLEPGLPRVQPPREGSAQARNVIENWPKREENGDVLCQGRTLFDNAKFSPDLMLSPCCLNAFCGALLS